MGCATSTVACVTKVHLVSSSRYLASTEGNIRDEFSVREIIAFNETTGLFQGEEIGARGGSVFVRISKIPPLSMKTALKRIEILKLNKDNFEHLLPYTKTEKRSHFLYLVTQSIFRIQSLISAISSNKLEVTEARLFKLFSPIFFTLAKMHASGVIHGQIAPCKFVLQGDTCYLYDPCAGTESTTDRIRENFEFLAPEDLANVPPSFESDVWGLGAVLYCLVVGSTVYNAKSLDECVQVSKGSVGNFHSPAWSLVSPALKNLIKRMLVRSKSDRIKMKDTLTHEWFRDTSAHALNIINTSYLTINHSYETCILKTKYYMANDHSAVDMKEYRKKFKELDRENVGYVSYERIVRGILSSDYTKCQHCDSFLQYPINYQDFLNDVTILNSLIMKERMTVLFEHLSGNKPYLESESIKRLLSSIAHSDYAVSGVFEDLVRAYQDPQREDVTLTYEEFWSMCQSIGFGPSEGFVIGGFF
eukprot:TRINITY_DN1838_c0_g1_i1.p1 TRINITY_DN1838_c0_g1~~TRINITY_DN1838_c0_g1_i1.p1  ORF type:complete len:475 (+),score=99.57 TRINITY_DN1838_c0_g1_i1:140-1564(+)